MFIYLLFIKLPNRALWIYKDIWKYVIHPITTHWFKILGKFRNSAYGEKIQGKLFLLVLNNLFGWRLKNNHEIVALKNWWNLIRKHTRLSLTESEVLGMICVICQRDCFRPIRNWTRVAKWYSDHWLNYQDEPVWHTYIYISGRILNKRLGILCISLLIVITGYYRNYGRPRDLPAAIGRWAVTWHLGGFLGGWWPRLHLSRPNHWVNISRNCPQVATEVHMDRL